MFLILVPGPAGFSCQRKDPVVGRRGHRGVSDVHRPTSKTAVDPDRQDFGVYDSSVHNGLKKAAPPPPDGRSVGS